MGHRHWSREEEAALTLAVNRLGVVEGKILIVPDWGLIAAEVKAVYPYCKRSVAMCVARSEALGLLDIIEPDPRPRLRTSYKLKSDTADVNGRVSFGLWHEDPKEMSAVISELETAALAILAKHGITAVYDPI